MNGSAARGGKVVVVGAGLAGLTCAKVLAGAGLPVVVVEAGHQPGGRVASQQTPDGFVLDRGFQVLLDSYPAARRHLDLRSLGGGRFRAGALLVGRGRPIPLENPLFRPSAVSVLADRAAPAWADLTRLGFLVGAALLRGPRSFMRLAAAAGDVSTAELFERRGFSADFLDRFVQPFLGGVLLDPGLETSGAWACACLARFATGHALLPGEGIGAIGRQLADSLPAGTIRYGTRADGLLVRDGAVRGVGLGDGSLLESDHVVVAADEPSVCRLLGCGTARAARSTAVHYFSATRAWNRGAWLCLPPRAESGPVLHAALLTNAAPTLAPPGRHLWSVTVLPDHPQAEHAGRVATQVAGWFGESPGGLTPVDFIRVDYAVPVQLPGFAARPAPWGEPPRGVRVAGDAATGASIDAAMASGEDAARSLLSPGGAN